MSGKKGWLCSKIMPKTCRVPIDDDALSMLKNKCINCLSSVKNWQKDKGPEAVGQSASNSSDST